MWIETAHRPFPAFSVRSSRVAEVVRSVVAIEGVSAAINQIAETTLRAVVGRHTLDEALSETDAINQNIREILDVQTADWGIEVTVVELKDSQLAREHEARHGPPGRGRREKRAKIIAAHGEALAAGELAAAPATPPAAQAATANWSALYPGRPSSTGSGFGSGKIGGSDRCSELRRVFLARWSRLSSVPYTS
jgi:hypothetical protein